MLESPLVDHYDEMEQLDIVSEQLLQQNRDLMSPKEHKDSKES